MKIGINGFGRVGQALLRRLNSQNQICVVAINEWGSSMQNSAASLQDKKIRWTKTNPLQIAWENYEIDVLVEASRLFTRKEMEQLSRGGRVTVIMTGDLKKGEPDLTLVLGVNEGDYDPSMKILCAGSDRTQALIPIFKAMSDIGKIQSYRLCIHRSPYTGNLGRIQRRPDHAEQLTQVLAGLPLGEVVRVDDPRADFVTMWLDIVAEDRVAKDTVRNKMRALATQLREAISYSCSPSLDSFNDRNYSAVVDLESITAGTFDDSSGKPEHHIWITLRYYPVESYAERIKEQLLFLSS